MSEVARWSDWVEVIARPETIKEAAVNGWEFTGLLSYGVVDKGNPKFPDVTEWREMQKKEVLCTFKESKAN